MAEPPLTALRRLAAAGAPVAPVHAALHVELRAIDPGHVTARMPTAPRDHLLDAVLVLADFAVGLAVTGTLAAGERIATLRLEASLLAPVDPGVELHAEGRLEHRDDALGVSTATVTDADGRSVARCTGRNAVLADTTDATDHTDRTARTDGTARAVPRWHPRPGPYALVVPLRDGEPDPVRHDDTVLVAHPDPTTANSAGAVQGGVLAGVAARALERALGVAPQDVAVTFLRAVPADGGTLVATARTEHRGRRLRSGHAELRDGSGRLVLSATGLGYGGGR